MGKYRFFILVILLTSMFFLGACEKEDPVSQEVDCLALDMTNSFSNTLKGPNLQAFKLNNQLIFFDENNTAVTLYESDSKTCKPIFSFGKEPISAKKISEKTYLMQFKDSLALFDIDKKRTQTIMNIDGDKNVRLFKGDYFTLISIEDSSSNKSYYIFNEENFSLNKLNIPEYPLFEKILNTPGDNVFYKPYNQFMILKESPDKAYLAHFELSKNRVGIKEIDLPFSIARHDYTIIKLYDSVLLITSGNEMYYYSVDKNKILFHTTLPNRFAPNKSMYLDQKTILFTSGCLVNSYLYSLNTHAFQKIKSPKACNGKILPLSATEVLIFNSYKSIGKGEFFQYERPFIVRINKK